MNKIERAMIRWISAEHGGRMYPPPGPRYITVCRFEEDGNWRDGAWSLVIEFSRQFSDPTLLLANIHFLVEEGPHDLLHSGSRFELLEGPKRVAKGVVLPAAVLVPENITEFESALIG